MPQTSHNYRSDCRQCQFNAVGDTQTTWEYARAHEESYPGHLMGPVYLNAPTIPNSRAQEEVRTHRTLMAEFSEQRERERLSQERRQRELVQTAIDRNITDMTSAQIPADWAGAWPEAVPFPMPPQEQAEMQMPQSVRLSTRAGRFMVAQEEMMEGDVDGGRDVGVITSSRPLPAQAATSAAPAAAPEKPKEVADWAANMRSAVGKAVEIWKLIALVEKQLGYVISDGVIEGLATDIDDEKDAQRLSAKQILNAIKGRRDDD